MERMAHFSLALASFLLLLAGCAGSNRVEQQTDRQAAPPPPPPVASPATAPSDAFRMPGSEPMPAEMQAVERVIDRFGRMWENESMEIFAEVIAHDPDMVIIGTDTAEYILGYEMYRSLRKEQFESFENVEFYVEDQRIRLSESGEVAWFTEQFDLFTIAQGRPVRLSDLRLSGVLEKRSGEWVIVQLHTSVPVAGQAAEY